MSSEHVGSCRSRWRWRELFVVVPALGVVVALVVVALVDWLST